MNNIFLALQIVIFVTLLISDLLPLGRLNDFETMSRELSLPERLMGTLINCVFVVVSIFLTAKLFMGLELNRFEGFYLYAFWPLFFLGMLINWWFPYLFGKPESSVKQMERLASNTIMLFPKFKGRLAPNLLHTLVHSLTLAVNFLLYTVIWNFHHVVT